MELRGDLQSFPFVQLIQTLDNAQRSGKLDIRGHLGDFAVFFQKGRIIHAQSPYSSGLPAFYDVFLENSGTFNFVSNVIMPPRRITASTASLLIEAAGLVDGLAHSGFETEPSKLQVSMVQEFAEEPVALTSDEFVILQNAEEPKSFDKILKDAEFGFFRAWTALKGLADKKMITLSKSEA